MTAAELDPPHDRTVLDRYETIRDYTRVMQHCARAGDWDRLIELQTTYVSAVQELAEHEGGITLTPPATDRKIALIGEIQTAEGEVRSRLEQRLHELSHFMTQARQRQGAVRAYETQGLR